MEESGSSVPEAVYIKREPRDAEDEAPCEPKPPPGVPMLGEQIKLEIDFKRVEPVLVKQEPLYEENEASSNECEIPWHENDVKPDPERLQTSEASSQPVVVEVELTGGQPTLKDCFEGDIEATGSQTDTQRDTETKPYTCEICGKKFKEIYFYIPHMELHEHNMEIVEESETVHTKVDTSKSGLYHHQQKQSCARFSCKHCDKQFTRWFTLKRHERIHTKPYSCDICKKSFAESSGLKAHNRRVHTDEKPYSCERCEKKFAHLSDFDIHKKIHTDEKLYSCEVCVKQFRSASHLVLHRRVHSNEEPHSCATCKKQFADVASLTDHQRIHTGEKPFPCEICKKQFISNSTLITHRVSHARGRFSCKICERHFMHLGNLRNHVKVQHPGETAP